MEKFVPYEKKSKKEKCKENQKKRGDWGNVNPRTKVIPDQHKDKKNEERMNDRMEDV